MTPEMEGLASLARKKAAIMADLKKLPKDKRNQQQNYGYASAEGVFDTIRALMVQHGLVLFTSAVSGNQEHFTSSKGTNGLHTTVQYRMLWVDTETGATVEDFWLSEGDDYQDKGYSKCATLALKYYLMTTFIVSSGDAEDDPDSGLQRKGQRKSEQTPPKPAATSPKSNAPVQRGATIPEPQEDAPESENLRDVVLTAVTVEKNETTGNRRMRFVTTDNLQSVFSWTRQPFITGGWCDERDWLEPNTYSLPGAAKAKAKWNVTENGGYWTVETVEPFQPDFLNIAS